MKILVFLTMLLSLSAKSEVIQTRSLVSVYDLSCKVEIGRDDLPAEFEQRAQTILRSYDRERSLVFSEDIELAHQSATTPGCDIVKLDAIKRLAMGRYWHLWLDVEIKKATGEPVDHGDGKCKAIYSEDLKIKFQNGVVLKSHASEYRPAEGCL